MNKPRKLDNLIEAFAKVPSIGRKSAEKISYSLIENDYLSDEILSSINDSKKLKKCSKCGILSDDDICEICTNGVRHKKLCIVSQSKDAYQIEAAGIYNGFYHVLGGEINIQRGIEPEKLNIDTIQSRIDELGINEVIFALNQTMEGEVTFEYIKSSIKVKDVSKLAQGLPIGQTLEHIDPLTLKQAFDKRRGE